MNKESINIDVHKTKKATCRFTNKADLCPEKINKGNGNLLKQKTALTKTSLKLHYIKHRHCK